MICRGDLFIVQYIKRHRGFSLIELLTVLVIMSVLTAAAMPLASLATKRIKEQELHYDLRQIRDAIDAYKRAGDDGRIARKVGDSGYPGDLNILADGVEDLRDPNKAKIYFLRAIPTDPFAQEGVTGADSWLKRSYASSSAEPKEGDDVFDVHSRSRENGLNGIPYDKW